MRGDTLHNMIHKDRHLYDYQSTMSILNQVAQGMEYLHAKSIAHPLLTSKSIGIYRGRACITMWAPYSSNSRCVWVCGSLVIQSAMVHLAARLVPPPSPLYSCVHPPHPPSHTPPHPKLQSAIPLVSFHMVIHLQIHTHSSLL